MATHTNQPKPLVLLAVRRSQFFNQHIVNVWNSLPCVAQLNIEQSYRIESIQKRAIKIIYGPGDYHDICMKQSLPTLAIAIVVELKFVGPTSLLNNSVLNKNSCLHYLLPRPRGEEVEKLRRPLPLVPQTAKTTRFQRSYLIYALNNQQIQFNSLLFCVIFLFLLCFMLIQPPGCHIQCVVCIIQWILVHVNVLQ